MKLLLAAIVLLATSLSFARAQNPNILVVFIDDMGWGDFSCFGNQDVETENIDRLAAEGIAFEQFYVNSPTCSPSRVALTTGMYPQRWDITSYLAHRSLNQKRGIANWLSLDAPSIARILKEEKGYATGHFGKWHMGGQRDVDDAPLITEYGFDESLTNFEGLGPKILAFLEDYDGDEPKRHTLGADKLSPGPVIWEERAYVTESFANSALNFIQRAEADNQPFFVNLWPDDVHTPLFPPKDKRGDGSMRELYEGVLDAMDEQFAPIFNYIRNSDTLKNNTIILICSDNGPHKGAGEAGPFRAYKATLFEGGIRSPLIVWAPGFIDPQAAGARNTESILSAMDLVPSLLQACGLSSQEIASYPFDGENLHDTLFGKSKQSRNEPLYFRRPPDRENFYGLESLPDLAVRSGKWKFLCEFDGTNPQLYDIESDRGETENLAAQHKSVVKRLTKQLLTWQQNLPQDTGPTFKRN